MTTVKTRPGVATHETEERSLPGLAQAEALPKLFESRNRGRDVNSARQFFYFIRCVERFQDVSGQGLVPVVVDRA